MRVPWSKAGGLLRGWLVPAEGSVDLGPRAGTAVHAFQLPFVNVEFIQASLVATRLLLP